MGIGPYKDTEGTIHGVNFKTTPVKFLGIYVGNDPEKCKEKNWDEKIKKIKTTLLLWKRRNLTFFGKITIIKSLVLPTITFTSQSTCVPPDAVKHIYRIDFIWGKRDRIKRNIMYQDILRGGVNMIRHGCFFLFQSKLHGYPNFFMNVIPGAVLPRCMFYLLQILLQ